MKNKLLRRFLPFMLSLAMTLEMIPMSVLAAEATEPVEVVSEELTAEDEVIESEAVEEVSVEETAYETEM